MTWMYAIALMFVGAIMGVFLFALVIVARDEREETRRKESHENDIR